MAPLGIPMSEEEPYEPRKRPKVSEEKKVEETAPAKPEAELQAMKPLPKGEPPQPEEPEEAPLPPNGAAGQAETARSFTDEYRQQMRNAAVLQAKQAEILQRQSEQLEYSQKLLERYDAILARHEEKLNES